MLIKQLTLENFRQFKEKRTIEFSTDPKSNITIILGENGGGKTTLAQAFLWLLYGETDFKDKKVINKKTINEVYEGQEAKVLVELVVEEEETEFIITRKQYFEKKANSVSTKSAELFVSYKKDGKMQFVPTKDAQFIVEGLLPRQLSGFFFFDGERIKNMSDEIQKGKSKEFANAVRNLVGLNTIMNTMNHLKETRSMATVIGRYNKKIEEVGGSEIYTLGKQIDEIETFIKDATKRLEKDEPQIDYYKDESYKLEQEILSFATAEQMRAEYDRLKRQISAFEKEKYTAIKGYLKHLNNSSRSFFSIPLIDIVLKELEKTEKLDKGIPHVHAETISYLIDRKKCLCGTTIEFGTEEYMTLTKLLDYLPPKSIGTMINTNVDRGNSLLKQGDSFNEVSTNLYKNIRKADKQLREAVESHTELYNRIVDVSNVGKLREKKAAIDNRVKTLKNEVDALRRLIGGKENELKTLIAKKEKFINMDKSNQKYKLYRDYARELYSLLEEQYNEAEISVRKDLQIKINRIFTEIYDGGLTLNLDENYNVKINVDELDSQHGDVERSTAQNYTVIFAFIAGIIEMAKQKSREEESTVFDNAVGYPLVMDAPLSAFDKRRINNICDTIPKIAEQVIFFIKDTDGDVAETHLGKSVGKKYVIKKESLLVSRIEERV